jgi:tetratricopeptide (TPR) repeat protein
MATERLADTHAAAADFARVVKLDPNYAPAYVELAAAKLHFAEFNVTVDRLSAYDTAREESKILIEQALTLDPKNAQAYIVRGNIRANSDPVGAEKDYRRGIELNPNSARGYDDLAALINDVDPTRRAEVSALIARAQRLDPLDPSYVVVDAKTLLYDHSDVRGADALVAGVVAHNPTYVPALIVLGYLRELKGRFADAAMYNEQVLKIDPLQEWTRFSLVANYVDCGDFVAARQVVEEAPHRLPIQRLLLVMYAGDWHQGAQLSYAALTDGTMLPNMEPWGAFALRMSARKNGDFRQARAALEEKSRVTWSASGIPTLPEQLGVASFDVALGDVLIASGDRDRGERLLRASVADMNYIIHDLKRGDIWYLDDQAIALALLGDRKASLATLRRALTGGTIRLHAPIQIDPAYSALRGDPEFQAIVDAIEQNRVRERHLLDRLRADGRIPNRAPPAPPVGWASK